MKRYMLVCGALVALSAPNAAWATDTPEVEPNDSKATATPVVSPMAPGDTLSGTSTSSSGSGIDTFLVQTESAATGIYRYRLTVTSSTAGHTATIRGLNQTAGVIGTTDSAAQTSLAASRFVQWYAFGHSEQLYFRVTGTTTTTSPYTATLTRDPVVAQDIPGTFYAGTITITTVGQGHSNDTDLWVYDENLNALSDFGNDDEGGGVTLQSRLTRTYSPGTYYLALANYNFANNLPSPADDDFRSGIVLDFPDAAIESATTTNVNDTFRITSTNLSVQVPATRTEAFQILWFRFVVENPPPFGACCLPNGSCLENQSGGDCSNAGGNYQGDGTTCATASCIGACCLPNGTCQMLSPLDCANASGGYQGDGTTCAQTSCPQPPTGACCTGTSCRIDDPFDCAAGGGTYQGDGTTCGTPAYALTDCFEGLEDVSGTGTPVDECDDCGVTVPIGFDFTYFGNSYSSVGIASNGYLHFGAQSLTDLSNDPIPSPTDPDNIIAVWWDDLNPAATGSGTVNWELRSSPTRFIVQWTGVQRFSTPGSIITAQAILYADGSIDLRYSQIDGFSGFSASVGIENIDGSAGYSIDPASLGAGSCKHFQYVAIDSPCALPFGACCLPDGNCLESVSSGACGAAGGSYQGNGSICAVASCRGACCLPDGSCELVAPAICSQDGGFYNGDGTSCSATQCTGACCFPNGTCQALGPAPCAAQGGSYNGNGTTCSPNICPQPPTGACCVGESCSIDDPFDCAANGGTYQGDGTTCESTSYTIDDCFDALEDISASGTQVDECDDCGVHVSLPFAFPFWNVQFFDVGIASNGYLHFGTQSVSDLSNDPIPSPTDPDNIIAIWWDDLNPAATGSGNVYWEQRTSPDRFIVQWNAVQRFGASGSIITAQAILYPDGSIDLRYSQVDGFAGFSASVGVENADGSVGYAIDPAGIGAGACKHLTMVVTPPPCSNPCAGAVVGDSNCDGVVDNSDIDCFVQALLGTPCANPGCPYTFECLNDANGDGVVDNSDIDCFVGLLLGSGCP